MTPQPDDLLPVYCQICREHIAYVVLRDVRFPLTGAMFLSPDPGHGILPPFHESHCWELFRCPHGGHRPLVAPDKILTAGGMLHVPPGQPPFWGPIMEESDRGWIMDRAIDVPSVMSDEEAAAQYRWKMAVESITETEAEGIEVDEGCEAGATGSKEAATSSLVCDRCQRSFKSRSGLMRHRRAVHDLRTAWGR